jgi:glycerol-3-phosphate dehydrogenase
VGVSYTCHWKTEGNLGVADPHVLIIGAGITGLTLAQSAEEKGNSFGCL